MTDASAFVLLGVLQGLLLLPYWRLVSGHLPRFTASSSAENVNIPQLRALALGMYCALLYLGYMFAPPLTLSAFSGQLYNRGAYNAWWWAFVSSALLVASAVMLWRGFRHLLSRSGTAVNRSTSADNDSNGVSQK